MNFQTMDCVNWRFRHENDSASRPRRSRCVSAFPEAPPFALAPGRFGSLPLFFQSLAGPGERQLAAEERHLLGQLGGVSRIAGDLREEVAQVVVEARRRRTRPPAVAGHAVEDGVHLELAEDGGEGGGEQYALQRTEVEDGVRLVKLG